MWVKIDDAYPSHPKVLAAGPLAMLMQVAGLCYCNRNLTDGFVPKAAARTLIDWTVDRPDGSSATVCIRSQDCHSDVTCDEIVTSLLSSEMWTAVPGGYQIAGYADYQPTRASIEADRQASADRQAQSRAKRRMSQGESHPMSRDSHADVTPDVTRDSTPMSHVGHSAPVPVPLSNNSPPAQARAREAIDVLIPEYAAGDTLTDLMHARRSFVDAYLHGAGINPGTAQGRKAQTEAHLIASELQTAGGMPIPATILDMTRYVRAQWSDGGIRTVPSITKVLDAQAEYDHWLLDWQQAGRPMQGDLPDYLMLRRAAKRKTIVTRDNLPADDHDYTRDASAPGLTLEAAAARSARKDNTR
jgi:hypothetical protein